PWFAEDESAWARLASPMAGAGRGLFILPEVGDEVLVAFEHGDINYPVIVGMLWNGRDKPPQLASAVVSATGKVNQRILKSRLGHTVTLDDSEESPGITIVDKTGKNIIKLNSQTNELTISVEGDLSLNAKGNISITAQRNVSITAQQGNLDASAQANASMEAKGGKATVKGVTGEVQASGPLNVRGATVNIN
ncbi:MAG: type IV secretion protein Rhs, partial [Chloroflexota bacterium]